MRGAPHTTIVLSIHRFGKRVRVECCRAHYHQESCAFVGPLGYLLGTMITELRSLHAEGS